MSPSRRPTADEVLKHPFFAENMPDTQDVQRSLQELFKSEYKEAVVKDKLTNAPMGKAALEIKPQTFVDVDATNLKEKEKDKFDASKLIPSLGKRPREQTIVEVLEIDEDDEALLKNESLKKKPRLLD